MKIKNILLPAALVACAINLKAETAVPAQPLQTESQQPSQQAFEASGYVDATLFVAAAKMAGTLHTVGAQAWNNGFQNTYQLTSGGTTLQITGTTLLIQRINEIYALDYLNGLSKTKEFTNALGKALGAKVDSVVGIVKNPVGTVRSLPGGASRFFGGIGEALKGGGGGAEGNLISKLAGVEKAKRGLAAKLGVSPYTDNQQLQDALTSTAQAMAGGGLVVTAASTAATGGAGAALTVISVNQTLQDSLVNTSPDDQRIINRKKLLALGLNRSQADAFLMNSIYNSWQQTIIVDALSRTGVNPQAFLNVADTASSFQDSSYFVRLAQLFLNYHKSAEPLKAILVEAGTLSGLDKNGTLVVPVSLDYGIWSDRVSARADEFSALLPEHKEIKALALWTDGQLSQRFRDELTKRSITWKMLALDANKN